jgi:hypothetical protein
MYTLQGGNLTNTSHTFHAQFAYGPRPCVSHTVNAYQSLAKSSTAMDKAIAPKKKGSQHNPQHDDWSIRGFVHSFSLEPAIEAVRVKSPSVDVRLLGLSGSYHQHMIDTFNTYSWGLTHRSLTDTGGGYNLKGTGFSHNTLWPFQTAVFSFPLQAPPGLQFNHNPSTKSEFQV